MEFVVVFAFFAFDRLRAGTALALEVEKELRLLLTLDPAFNLVDLYEKTTSLCFQEVVGVIGTVSNPCIGDQIAQAELLGDPHCVSFMERCINSHACPSVISFSFSQRRWEQREITESNISGKKPGCQYKSVFLFIICYNYGKKVVGVIG